MLEALLGNTLGGDGGGEVGDFFIFDGSTVVPYTTSISPGAVFESSPSIDGKTLRFEAGSSDYFEVVFGTPLNLKSGDWTLEWSTKNLSAVTGYNSEIALTPDTVGQTGITSRYGNNAYGDRLQFGGTMSAPSVIANSRFTKALLVNTLKRFALVQTAGRIALFVDGVKEKLALGTTASYTLNDFTSNSANSAITRLRLGSLGPSLLTLTSLHGPIRFSLEAKYQSDYIPVPF